MRAGNLAGIVLAGGASRRMGRDKATLRIAGRTLVERLVAIVGQRCAPLFVVAAPGQELPDLPAQVLYDEVPGLGPLPALGLGLRAAARAGAARAFVCAVDMPFLTPELIDLLAESTADIVLPHAGRDHYLAGVYRTALGETVAELAAAGERRVGALVDAAHTERIVLTDPAPLANLNFPDDLPDGFAGLS
ncbi:molybdenum cofactor guanylyltransferase [Mycobacterium sp. M1]|uniref:Probable molybdenum cofactor guanylyltransferase n=1 Tax=Mycolicibacter acidiphilus TaxID=2835306 RepID=A0ABS5RIK5_9MYCO|nr:molybdenum cofactor guanylyltransferase [Mycolicibacter acidiphilus]MBS9533408.1 molybdenum cofactor guanylyltransferase [Mycolicibacter acidiphilus]